MSWGELRTVSLKLINSSNQPLKYYIKVYAGPNDPRIGRGLLFNNNGARPDMNMQVELLPKETRWITWRVSPETLSQEAPVQNNVIDFQVEFPATIRQPFYVPIREGLCHIFIPRESLGFAGAQIATAHTVLIWLNTLAGIALWFFGNLPDRAIERRWIRSIAIKTALMFFVGYILFLLIISGIDFYPTISERLWETGWTLLSIATAITAATLIGFVARLIHSKMYTRPRLN